MAAMELREGGRLELARMSGESGMEEERATTQREIGSLRCLLLIKRGTEMGRGGRAQRRGKHFCAQNARKVGECSNRNRSSGVGGRK